MPLIGLAEDKGEALPVHPLTVGIVMVAAAQFSVFQAVETSEAQPVGPKGQGQAGRQLELATSTDSAQPVAAVASGSVAVGLGILGSVELAQPIAAKGQGQVVRDLAVLGEVSTALPVSARNVPTSTLFERAILYNTITLRAIMD